MRKIIFRANIQCRQDQGFYYTTILYCAFNIWHYYYLVKYSHYFFLNIIKPDPISSTLKDIKIEKKDLIFPLSLCVQPRSQWSSVWSCQCAPIGLIKSFCILHWLWVHRSNSHYVTTLSGSAKGWQQHTQLRNWVDKVSWTQPSATVGVKDLTQWVL